MARFKQINEALTSSKTTSFKQVVMVEFPRAGLYSIGFITGAQHGEVQEKTKERVVGVFVPTTPNPTTGFIVLVPEGQIIKLDMSVADGIKYIMSLGSVAPAYLPPGTAPGTNGPTVEMTAPVIVADGTGPALAPHKPTSDPSARAR